MGKNKEVMEDASNLVGATLLIKSMTRLEENLSNTTKLAKEHLNRVNISYSDLVEAIALLSGDKKSREYLVNKCTALIRQVSREYEYRPLTLKIIAQIKQAVLFAVGSHFGRWDELFQKEVLQVMGKVNVLEDQTTISDEIMNAIDSLRKKEDK